MRGRVVDSVNQTLATGDYAFAKGVPVIPLTPTPKVKPKRVFFTSPWTVFALLPTLLMSDNDRRIYLLVQNNGADDVYVSFQGVATVNSGVLVPSGGGSYQPFIAPHSSVYIVAAHTQSSGVSVEGTLQSLASVDTSIPGDLVKTCRKVVTRKKPTGRKPLHRKGRWPPRPPYQA